MWRKRSLRITVALILSVIIFSAGCLRNTPKNVSKRFILSIKDLKWDRMVKMVDWDTTAKYAHDLPEGSKKDIVYSFASVFTKNKFDEMTEAEIKHKLVYMALDSVKIIEESDGRARVKVVCRLEAKKKQSEVTLNLKKVKREWKIVLTPHLFERQN